MTGARSGTLVIGVGNEFRGDDGAGLSAARYLRKCLSVNVRVLEQTGECGALLDAWQHAARAVLLDAVQSGMPPGTIHRWHANVEPVPRQYFQHSTHGFGVAEAIDLARVLNCLPTRLVVYGIEGENFESRLGLSSPVEQAVQAVVSKVVAELASQILMITAS